MNDGAAIIVLARRAARKAVEAELRAQGRRLQDFSNAELVTLAGEYFEAHQTELLEKATAQYRRIVESWIAEGLKHPRKLNQ